VEAGCTALADNATAAFTQRVGAASHLRVSTDRVYSVMTRVLSAADTWARGDTTAEERAAAVEAARTEYAAVARTVNAAIQRQARFVYFQGVLLGAALAVAASAGLGVLDAALWPAVVSPASMVAATVFGALGALASVFQRISTGRLVLDFSASRGQLVTLGGIRPFIGALFGVIVQFFLVASVLGTTTAGRSTAASFATFAIAGFASGFSERFATDMIERAGSVIAGTAQPTSTPGGSSTARRRGRQPAGDPAAGDIAAGDIAAGDIAAGSGGDAGAPANDEDRPSSGAPVQPR
jgi:hypothetical protein